MLIYVLGPYSDMEATEILRSMKEELFLQNYHMLQIMSKMEIYTTLIAEILA